MNQNLKKIFVSLLTGTVLVVSFATMAAQKPETLIKWRQSAFQVVAWNAGRIKAAIESPYDKDEVIKAANAIASVANSGLGSLFPPGTEQGKGWHDTSAKPELFKQDKRFTELLGNFGKEANELAKVAAVGDVGAVKEQYGRLTRACKACHDDFKSKD